MPRQHLDNLISRLHNEFSPGFTSPEQQRLMNELQLHLHNSSDPAPAAPSPRDTANALLESLEVEHPQAAAVIREIIETLGRLGL